MRISGIVPCVDYSDIFSKSIRLWMETLDSLLVVTSRKDRDTAELVVETFGQTHPAADTSIYKTDVWFANGASLNKGAAMSEAVLRTGFRKDADWILAFDADVIPPPDWRDRLELMELRRDTIYGAYRYYEPAPEDKPVPRASAKRMPQGFVIGFFNLFHNSSPHLPPKDQPLWELCWPHAGNVDTLFMRRFPEAKRHILDIPMTHVGEERKNWCGRHNRPALERILGERCGWEDWERERMPDPPKI